MSIIETCVLDFFHQYPRRNIVIAYSGGVDSQVLLHVLAKLKQQGLNNQVSACHVNHGLSKNALLWQQNAEQHCSQLGITLTVCQVNIKAQAQHSLEAQAREARYLALAQTAGDQALVVTGHHSDDQSETLLLALKRGAGLKGLSAMAKTRPLAQHLLVRPLLDITRQQILDYAHQHHLDWVEDESNQDCAFDRNFIRHQVMPVLSQRWPSIVSTLKRSSAHCLEAQSLLNELAQDDLLKTRLFVDSGANAPSQYAEGLNVSALRLHSQARFNNLLRYFLSEAQCLMPSAMALSQVYSQLGAAPDKSPAVKIGEKWLRRFKDGLYLTDDYKDVSTWQRQIILGCAKPGFSPSTEVITLPDELGQLQFSQESTDARTGHVSEPCSDQTNNTKVKYQAQLRQPLMEQSVRIVFMHDNPRCLPDYRQQSRPLKKILQELGIPPWQRKRIPFVYYNQYLVAALGHFVCRDFMAIENQVPVNVCWLVCRHSG
jgi:tRNA(Ile)-lysidine synthase